MTSASQPSSEARGAAQQRPRVIYLMGAGRSGSTILGVMLGNCSGVFYAGELDAWLRSHGVPNFSGRERTRFWQDIRERVSDGHELFGDDAWRSLEHSLAPFRIRQRRRRRGLRCHYHNAAEQLYRAIARGSGTPWIVDSSHYPLRAREIQQIHEIDLYLIYLVRDAHSVVSSFQRKDVTNPSKARLATEAYLHLTHIFSVLVFVRHPKGKRLLLHYEDFAADPDSVLRRILSWLELPGAPPALGALRTGVPFQGNRLLESEVISFRAGPHLPDTSPAANLTRLLQLPWSMVHSALRPRATPSPSRARRA